MAPSTRKKRLNNKYKTKTPQELEYVVFTAINIEAYCTLRTQCSVPITVYLLSVLRRIKGPIEFRERNAQCQHSLKIFNNIFSRKMTK